jgi:hypothetical protein
MARATSRNSEPDFAGDQHGGVGAGNLLDQSVESAHRQRSADEVLVRRSGFLHRPVAVILFLQAANLAEPNEDAGEMMQGEAAGKEFLHAGVTEQLLVSLGSLGQQGDDEGVREFVGEIAQLGGQDVNLGAHIKQEDGGAVEVFEVANVAQGTEHQDVQAAGLDELRERAGAPRIVHNQENLVGFGLHARANSSGPTAPPRRLSSSENSADSCSLIGTVGRDLSQDGHNSGIEIRGRSGQS